MIDVVSKLTFDNSEFALKTIRERWPVIIAQLIDSICRNELSFPDNQSPNKSEKLKELNSYYARLRYEVTTNKPLTLLESTPIDIEELNEWNRMLKENGVTLSHPINEYPSKDVVVPCWYDLPWLFTECYLYRRITDDVIRCNFEHFDPFFTKKQHAFRVVRSRLTPIFGLLKSVSESSLETIDIQQNFTVLLHTSLWANEFDLSLHPEDGYFQSKSHQLASYVAELENKLVVNDTDICLKYFTNYLSSTKSIKIPWKCHIAIILDNAGPELVADLILAEFLYVCGFVSQVSFHGKCIPWFVSDVTSEDFHWLLHTGLLEETEDKEYNDLACHWSNIWQKRIKDKIFDFKASSFWTLPSTYDEMKTVDPKLYHELSNEYDVIIFKGDLNYRKLVQDRNWIPDNMSHKINAFHSFQLSKLTHCDCRQKFHDLLSYGSPLPSYCPHCPLVLTLRVAKSDVAVGLNPSKYEQLISTSEDWWTIGHYGFVQIVSPIAIM